MFCVFKWLQKYIVLLIFTSYRNFMSLKFFELLRYITFFIVLDIVLSNDHFNFSLFFHIIFLLYFDIITVCRIVTFQIQRIRTLYTLVNLCSCFSHIFLRHRIDWYDFSFIDITIVQSTVASLTYFFSFIFSNIPSGICWDLR